MNKKKILILGASLYQLQAIEAAQRAGLYVITTDNIPDNPGHRLADKSYGISTTDRDKVLEIAMREQIDGIIAPCTDVAVPTAAYVAERLQLIGPPLQSAEILCSKWRFRRFLEEHHFPAPPYFLLDDQTAITDELFTQNHWLLKPDQSSGSKGIYKVDSVEELNRWLPISRQFSLNQKVVLEGWLEGFQGTIEGVLVKGEIALAFILDRQTAPPPFVATWGHHVPTLLPKNIQQSLLRRCAELWRLFSITDSVFDCDFVVSQDEIYILEMTPRLGGNSISKLLKKAANFDIVDYAVRQACGMPTPLLSTTIQQPTAIVLLGVMSEGSLTFDQNELSALQKEPWVDSILLDKHIGDPVEPFINGRNRVGEAIVFGRNRQELDLHVQELKRRLKMDAQ